MTVCRMEVVKDAAAIARAAAELFVKLAAQAASARRPFRVLLAGGTTPKAVYTLLASPEYRSRVEWDRIAFFFGDERAVPPDHPQSNYRMADEALFRPLGLPASSVHRMKAEAKDLDAAAAAYEGELRACFGALPRFDLVLLGMGADGHTASLFPRSPVLKEQSRWVAPVLDAPKPPPRRLTVTLPVLNAGHQVLFTVAGRHKASALREVLEGTAPSEQYPAKCVQPGPERLLWLVDEAAGAELQGR
ncbi:MAG TPA: 6-phosphogluconolactonase [Nitrospirales bacterium]|nr:6-phosphogluconolactonase [Nitrospirales bacterium]